MLPKIIKKLLPQYITIFQAFKLKKQRRCKMTHVPLKWDDMVQAKASKILHWHDMYKQKCNITGPMY